MMNNLYIFVVFLCSFIVSCKINSSNTKKYKAITVSELNDQEWAQLLSDLGFNGMDRIYFENVFNPKCTNTNNLFACLREEILLEVERWTQKDPIEPEVLEWLRRKPKILVQLYSLGAGMHELIC